MPEYYDSSHFLEHDELDLGADLDNFFDVNAVDFGGDIDHAFAENQFLGYPDEVTGDQNTLQVNGHRSPEQREADLPYGIFDVEEPNEELKGREEVSEVQDVASAKERASHEKAQKKLPNAEHRSQHELNDISDTQGELPDLQDVPPQVGSSSSSQPQEGPVDGGHHSLSESNDNRESHQDPPSLQDPSSATDSFYFPDTDFGISPAELLPDFDLERYKLEGGEEASAGMPNNGQLPNDEFDFSNILNKSVDHTIRDGSSRAPDLVADDEQRVQKRLGKAKQRGSSKARQRGPLLSKQHAPDLHGNLDTSAAGPSTRAANNGQDSVFRKSGIDSVYGNPSQGPTRGSLLVTPYQMNNAIQRSGSGNMRGGQSPAHSSQHPEEYGEDEADADEDIAESDPNFNPANDLNYYAENLNTGVIESRRRKGWGRTGMRNGVELWLNPETGEWQESASHHSYREILIARAQAEHPDERYLHPDKTDGLPHGETAFFLPHQNLGPDLDDCPDEMFVWPPEPELEAEPEGEKAGKKVQVSKKRKPNPRPLGPDPGFWFEDGKILLDPHNNPVNKHPDMPLTLSSNTEGYKLNLMRVRNPNISQKDEWARMPRWIYRREKKTGRYITRYIGNPNTHVNMPSVRFREKKGTVAGQKHDGSDNIREGLRALFAENGFDPSLSGSTRGFGRDLLRWEQDLVKLGNAGMFPERAGDTRGLDEQSQTINMQKTLKRIEKGRKQQAEAQAAKASGASAKRPRDEQEEQTQDLDPPPRKRVYQDPAISPSNKEVARKDAKTKSGGHPQNNRRKSKTPQTQRYGTNGVMPTLNRSINTLDAGGRSRYGTFGTARSPQSNANTLGADQQAPSLNNNQFMRNQSIPYYPSTELENDAGPDHLQQGYRGETWPAQAPVESPYFQGGQYQQQPPGFRGTYPSGLYQRYGGNTQYVGAPYRSNGPSQVHFSLGNASAGSFHEAEPYQPPQYIFSGSQNVQVNSGRPTQTQHSSFYPPQPRYSSQNMVNGTQNVPFGGGRHKQAQQGQGSESHTLHPRLTQDTSSAPIPVGDLDGDSGSGGYVLPQTLGKRDQPQSRGESQEDSLGHGGKRRRMPGTEGYNLPPGTHRRAEKKLRKSKRDEHVPPPVFNIGGSGQTAHAAPQPGATLEDEAPVFTPSQASQVADAPGRDPQETSTPVPAGQMPTGDIRDVPPRFEWECLRLQQALDYTRWAYRQWTGTDAPETNRLDSYNAQFGVMFHAFRTWWLSDRNPERGDPVEWLVGLDPWEGTVANWEPPVTDDLFYECMRRGFYAPRNEDGSLVYPGYRHIYADYPWYNPADGSQMK